VHRWNQTVPFLDTNPIDPQEPPPDSPGGFFNSQTMIFVYHNTMQGVDLHEHSHPNEKIWQVIDGEIQVMIGGKESPR